MCELTVSKECYLLKLIMVVWKNAYFSLWKHIHTEENLSSPLSHVVSHYETPLISLVWIIWDIIFTFVWPSNLLYMTVHSKGFKKKNISKKQHFQNLLQIQWSRSKRYLVHISSASPASWWSFLAAHWHSLNVSHSLS